MIKESFPMRVLAITFMVLALPLLVNSFFFFQRSYIEAVREAKEDLRYVANTSAIALHQLEPVDEELLSEVAFILQRTDPSNYSKMLAHLTQATPGLDFFVLLPKGDFLFSTIASNKESSVGTIMESYKQLPRILAGDDRSFFYYRYSEESNRFFPYLYRAQPFFVGHQEGLILGRGEVGSALQKSLHAQDLAENVDFALLQSEGIVITASDPDMIGELFVPLTQTRRGQLERQEKLGDIPITKEPLVQIEGERAPFFLFLFKGQLQLAYRIELTDIHGSLIVYLPKIIFFTREIKEFLIVYLFYGLIFLLGGIATYWSTIWLSRPLKQLSLVMNRVKQGNLQSRFVAEPFGYEINFLGNIFNTTVRSLLETMQSIENEQVQKETYERELLIGRKVQETLLPEPVKITKDVEIVGHYSFAKEVGGDFFDYSVADKEGKRESIITLTIADASGRGLSSCLYALAARSFIRSASTLFEDLEKTIVMANNAFLQDTGDTGMFVTLLMGKYNSRSKILTYYSCGHVPGLIKRKNGQVVILEHDGMAMGLMELDSIREHHIILESGDFLIFYTSGLIDVSNERGVIFSQKKLVKYLEKTQRNHAADWVQAILAEVMEYKKSTLLEEEITLVVMKVL